VNAKVSEQPTKTVIIDGQEFEISSQLSIYSQVECWMIDSQSAHEFVEAILEHAPAVAEWISDLWIQKKQERADLKVKLSSLSDADLQTVEQFIETGEVPAEYKEAFEAYQRKRDGAAATS